MLKGALASLVILGLAACSAEPGASADRAVQVEDPPPAAAEPSISFLGYGARSSRAAYVAPGSGGAPVALQAAPSGDATEWTRDGKRLVFSAEGGTNVAIHAIAVPAGGDPDVLTPTASGPDAFVASPYGEFVLTPDGGSLVYNGLSGDPWTDPTSVSMLVKVPLSGGPPEVLGRIGEGCTGDAKLATAMGLSPDGNRLAFVRWDSAAPGAEPTQNLYAMVVSGPGSREPVLLDTDVCFQQGRVSWSPDSRTVTYTKAEAPAADDRCDVWAVDAVQPGPPSNVSRRAFGHCTVPTFSPTDATIASVCNAEPYAASGGEIVLVDPSGTVEARAAVDAAQGRGNLAWDAAGERVAFTHVGRGRSGSPAMGIAALDRRTAAVAAIVEPQFVYVRHLAFQPVPER